ncbi:MAG: WecB/TagA/CpsF family glycosyltransferase [Clostridiaceae bacterium]|jgi:N-acetylglucosaminyldiphosphoundecaprenol N-acetyl-beta-D-mannosaminyltransferase|nr:WecB/TagA/CpsF family glycosyltransferase [Clostridiaceae bacterium]
MNRIDIHGVKIHDVNMNEAIDLINSWINETEITSHAVYTPNSEIIMQAQRSSELKNTLNNANLLVADGAGVVLASKILKTPLKEKVSGVDLAKNLLKAYSGKDVGFYLLGGEPGVADLAAVNIISNYGKVKITGYNHGYFKSEEENDLIDKINSTKPDILLVGLGAPKQELWIHNNMYRLNCKVMIGVGGSIDIFAGKVSLTPEFIRKAGFEWLHRLLREPRRIKRMMDLPRFMLKTIKKRFIGK